MQATSTCAYCAKEFSYDNKSKTGKFCSNSCCGKYKVEISSTKRIEEGLCREPKTLKKYLSNNRGYKCEECSITDWNGKELSLHVDHIDGDSDNNFPTNLRLLCPNCHSQTATFSGRNKKNTKRNSYMQRYRLKKLVGDHGFEPRTL